MTAPFFTPGRLGVERLLQLARRHLGMDVAFLAEFTNGKHVYRALDGDAASFGWELNEGLPLAQTYCRRMTTGELPNAISDARADHRVKDLPVTAAADIGSYVGVPLKRADGTLYGSLCCFSHAAESLHERDVSFMAMVGELVEVEVAAEAEHMAARARILGLIENRRLDVALQPIVSIADGRLLGVEALSRFPAGGPPDVVFAEAHRVGLGLELEALAAATAFDVLPLLHAEHYVALNLTPLAAFDLAARAISADDLPYDRLVLEITEHAAVENYDELRTSLAAARERGLRLAIDDAGAGHASLHHIVELEPDIIKIDRSLIDAVATGTALQSVVKAFVALASDLGATVVAEGVEQDDDLLAVADLSVDAVQGYLLGRPSTDRSLLARWVTGWQLDRAVNVNRHAERRRAFGQLIRDLRGSRRQVEVLRAVNAHLESTGEDVRVSQGQYSAYEHGRERPNATRVRAIEVALHVESGTLAAVLDPPPARP